MCSYFRSQENGGLAKEVSAECNVTAKETKTTQGYWPQQYIWHSEQKLLSGPVLRDTARLSQRYPPYCALYGVLGCLNSGTKNQPKSKFWGRTSGGRPCGYPGGRPGAKASVKPSKSWKNKHFGVDVHDPKVRTSMTPGGFKKTSVRKTSG